MLPKFLKKESVKKMTIEDLRMSNAGMPRHFMKKILGGGDATGTPPPPDVRQITTADGPRYQ